MQRHRHELHDVLVLHEGLIYFVFLGAATVAIAIAAHARSSVLTHRCGSNRSDPRAPGDRRRRSNECDDPRRRARCTATGPKLRENLARSLRNEERIFDPARMVVWQQRSLELRLRKGRYDRFRAGRTEAEQRGRQALSSSSMRRSMRVTL